MRHSIAATIAWVVLLLPFPGCGPSSTPTGVATSPVRGKVTFRGRPLTKGTISFEPEGAGKEAFGAIQPDGSFVMSTYRGDDGAVIGKHRVSVSNAGTAVPLKYASFAASRLEVEVSEGKTDYTFDLK